MVPRIRTVSCAEAGKAMQVKAKLAAASMRWSVLDIVILPGSELPADGSITGPKGRPAKCLKDASSATPVSPEYS
jgi:hypothetical protein